MKEILAVDNICSGYGNSQILNNVTFKMSRKDKLAIIGRNGVGKTTLLRTLMGMNELKAGEICYLGNANKRIVTYEVAQEGLAYVPQGREIFIDFTVQENLIIGGIDKKEDERKARFEQVLGYFPALRTHLNRKGGLLSGGLQQQLAIGRALMGNPKLLLLDEPTEGIQPNIVAEIVDILNRINEEMNLPIILVEQNLKFAFEICNCFIVLQKGKVVAHGSAEEMSEEIINKYLTV